MRVASGRDHGLDGFPVLPTVRSFGVSTVQSGSKSRLDALVVGLLWFKRCHISLCFVGLNDFPLTAKKNNTRASRNNPLLPQRAVGAKRSK